MADQLQTSEDVEEIITDTAVEIAQIEADKEITLAVIHTEARAEEREAELSAQQEREELWHSKEREELLSQIAELQANNGLLMEQIASSTNNPPMSSEALILEETLEPLETETIQSSIPSDILGSTELTQTEPIDVSESVREVLETQVPLVSLPRGPKFLLV